MSMPDSAFAATTSLAFASESWAWVAVVFAVLAALILFFSYRHSPLRGASRWFALSLKAAGLLLLALVLLEPVRLEEQPRKNANDLAVVADNSAGLTVSMSKGEPAPSERLREALAAGDATRFPEWMEAIGETFRLQTFVFDRTLRRSPAYEELDFERPDSNLGATLSAVETRFAQRPLAATILFTDGNATDPDELEAWFGRQERERTPGGNAGDGGAAPPGAFAEKISPVFPVIVGQSNPEARDLALTSIDASLTQFEDARVTLTVTAAARGDFPDPVELFVLDEEGEELAKKPVTFPPGPGPRELTTRLRLAAVPPGVSFLEAGVRQTAPEPVEELTNKNNRRGIAVNQGSGPYRILYVSGRPNWEYKFLRRSLAEDAELELVGLIRIAKREPKFEWRGRVGETSNPLFRGFDSDVPEETRKYDEPVLVRLNTASPEELRDGFPSSPEELFPRYRAIVIDDVEAEFFTREQQELIDRFVAHRGGTLVMLGGQETFAPGGWRNTPVGRLLPVYLEDFGESPPALEATYDLTREGWLEPWMRLRSGQDEEQARLARMPDFHAVNRIRAIKPGARLLATVTDSASRELPAVVTQRFGEGRAAAVPVADFWRWGMQNESHQEELARNWRQLMRWCVNDAPSRVELEKVDTRGGGLPLTRISVRVRDEAFDFSDDATVVLTVTDRDGSSSVLTAEPSLEEPGLFTAEHSAPDSSGYRIAASAVDGDGIEIGTAETARALDPEAREFASLGPNRALLERIATSTGGQVIEIDALDRLPSLLAALDLPVVEVRRTPLWHAPWLFLLALAFFVGEWILRRRGGIL